MTPPIVIQIPSDSAKVTLLHVENIADFDIGYNKCFIVEPCVMLNGAI